MRDLPSVDIQASSDVRRFGDPERQLSRAARAGRLERVRRGSYVDSAAWKALTPDDQHLIRMIAASAAAKGSPIFSHESAAVAWRFPIVEGLPGRLQITVPPGSGLKTNRVAVRHEARLDRSEIVSLGEVRITGIDRTLVDFMACRSFLSGACAAESLLHRELIDAEGLRLAVNRRRPFRGSRKVDAVVRFASGASGSPNETLCRVRFEQLGYPQPIQQREYSGPRGERYLVDFFWPEFDVICESDGRVKYEDPTFLAGRTPQQALWDEKVREDELRAQCKAFVRLTWDDAWNRTGLVSKLERAGIPRLR
jgi:hypothetical protein